jgi:ATP-dependent Zn protease
VTNRKITKKLERIAYHEAGHAAAYLILNKAFRYVTIEPETEEGTLGHCMGILVRNGLRLQEDVYEGNARARRWIEDHAIISAAGNVAEC